MKKIIKLRVPAEDPDAETPRPEMVSHGNFDFELKPGSTILVEEKHERVSNWLIDAHGLEEIGREEVEDDEAPHDPDPAPAADETDAAGDESEEEEVDFAAGYPDDFPGRDALIAAEVPHATAITLSSEQLVKYPKIGPATADAIVAYVNGGNE